MKKTWKVMLTFLIVFCLLMAVTGCGKQKDDVETDSATEIEGTTLDEGDPDYDVEDDLVEGLLTDDMLDQMEEEEATTEEEKQEEEKEKDPFANLKKYYIKVNRKTNVVTIYTYDEQGNYTKPVKAMVCSVGKSSSPTPAGKFKISTKHRWQLMKGDVYSQYCSRITGHILFHSVPYRETKSNTLFSGYYDRLGSAASAGCVRLTCGDALWIYNNCSSGTVVEIFDGSSGNDPLGKPGAMKLSGTAYSNWDPTDPVSNNPWKTAKPIITADNFTVELGSEKVDLVSKATVKDAYGTALNATISGNVDTSKAGIYSVTYEAKDSRGNTAKKTITVTVKDTKAPTITTSLNGKVYTGERTAAVVSDYVKKNTTVSDASRSASITDVKVNIAEAEGKISCTITAKDGSGNTATVTLTMTFEVVVPDEPSTETPPTTEEKPETPPTTEEKPETPPTTEEKPETPPSSEDVSTEENTSTEVTPTLEEGTNPEEGQDL